jgi:CDP-diacylglycerol--glycerol-3-phosphate 3-phosphatidyltransferase
VFNLPNILTLTRIFAAPLMVVLLYVNGPVLAWFTAAIFAVACVTDLVDGKLARGRGQVTAMGKFLDPLADKILIGSVLVMLVWLRTAPAWVVVLILSREMAVTGVRAMASERGIVMAADNWGKWKTVIQCLACGGLILNQPFLGLHLGTVGLVLLYLALILTVFSGANYLYKFYRILLDEERREEGESSTERP